MTKRFYLDTSVIVNYFIGTSNTRNLLKQKLLNKTRVTSNFAKMEFNRSVILELIKFYFVLSGKQKISDAIILWNQNYSINKIKNVNNAIAPLFAETKDNDIDLALFRLRTQIKHLIMGFNILIKRYGNNNSNCILGSFLFNFQSIYNTEDTENELARFVTYSKKNHINNCNIVNLLKNSSKEIEKILKYDSKKSSFKKLKEKLLKIIQRLNKNLTCFACTGIGDFVIAIECPNYATLLTFDEIFIDLSQFLEFKFEILPSVTSLESNS